MATARRSPTAFVNVPGNGLDAFEPEISVPPSTPVASSPLLEIVSAYPEPEVCPAAWRSSPKEPFRLRRLVTAPLSVARTVVLFPFVVLSWFILRIWWLIELAFLGMWRAVTGTVRLIAHAFAATGRIREALARAIAVAGALIARSAAAVAALTRATVRAGRNGIAGLGRVLARGAAVVRSASVVSVRATLDGVAFAGALIARSAATVAALARTTVRAMWNSIIIASVRLLIGAATASARAGRNGIDRLGRAMARGAAVVHSASIASVRATLDGVAFTRALIARSAATATALARTALRGKWNTAVITSTRLLIGAATFGGRAGRNGIDRLGRAMARGASVVRSASVASVHGTLDGVAFTGALIARSSAAGVPPWAHQARLVPVVAVVLTAAAGISVGFAILGLPQRNVQRVAAPAPDAPVVVAATAPVVMAVTQSAPEPPAPDRPTSRRADPTTPADDKRSLSPERVRDLWSKTDTRSLDRALTSLRSRTLAFQRCEMRMTSDDRAVAHCDESGPDRTAVRVAWTIDFRRNDGRWLIDGLSSTTPARLNR